MAFTFNGSAVGYVKRMGAALDELYYCGTLVWPDNSNIGVYVYKAGDILKAALMQKVDSGMLIYPNCTALDPVTTQPVVAGSLVYTNEVVPATATTQPIETGTLSYSGQIIT